MLRKSIIILALALSCAGSVGEATAQWASGVPGACGAPMQPCPQGGGGVSVPNYTPNQGLPNFAAALKNINNQVAVCMGESTPAGWGSQYGASLKNNDAHSASWCNQLALHFQLAGYNVQTNSLAGDNNANGLADTCAIYQTYDSRVSCSSWVPNTTANQSTLGGQLWYSNAVTSTFTFTPGDTTNFPSAGSVLTDTLVIWPLQVNSSAFATLTVGNGSGSCTNGTINTNNPAAPAAGIYAPIVVTCPGTGAAWTISCAGGGGANVCFFGHLIARLSTSPEISLINASAAGFSVLNQVAAPGNSYDPQTVLKAMNPVLTILQDLGNDIVQGNSLASVTTNTGTIIGNAQLSGDFLLVTTNPQNPGSSAAAVCTGGNNYYDCQQSYVTAQISAATTKNAAYWDYFKYLCGTISGSGAGSTASLPCWKAGQRSGWNAINAGGAADNNHQGPPAYATQGVYLGLITAGK